VLDEIVNGSVTRTYAYGRQLISENQLIGSTWTPSFYGYDGHGNARFLANSAGTITDTYTYDAFGMPIASTGTTPNAYLYSGERFDSNLNLYHLRARYYNMLTGRFMTMDPVSQQNSCCGSRTTFDPSTLHAYIYAQNNPVNRIDPQGTDSFEEESWLFHWQKYYQFRALPLRYYTFHERVAFCLAAKETYSVLISDQNSLLYFEACMAGLNAPFN